MSAPPLWRQAAATQPEKDPFLVSQGDATSFQWSQPVNAVACEGYLGKPFSRVPTDIELKEQKVELMLGNHTWNNDTYNKSIKLLKTGENTFVDQTLWPKFLDFCLERLDKIEEQEK